MFDSTMAPQGLLFVLMFVSGCGSASRNTLDAKVDLTLDPSPPVVGTANVSLRLAATDGRPIEGAKVRLEGNMNHAGMKPTFSDLEEVAPGNYDGTLELTMGGDWFLLVTATTPDGKRLERKIDVPGVTAP